MYLVLGEENRIGVVQGDRCHYNGCLRGLLPDCVLDIAIGPRAYLFGDSVAVLLYWVHHRNDIHPGLQALHHRGINILSAVSRANQHGSDRLAGLWQYVYRHTRPSFVLIQI